MRKRILTYTLIFAAASALFAAAPAATQVISLDGKDWRLAVDPKNVGVAEEWWREPRPDARGAKVPWTIQDVFPGYAGVAWYWRDVTVPVNPHAGGRYLLRFWDVDYLADIWLNGVPVGTHEGTQACFTLDATAAVRPGTANRLAVRVVSPFKERIEGLVRNETPHGAFVSFNMGGILDSVELIIAPPVRIEDLFVRADPKSGIIRLQTEIRNESNAAVSVRIEFSVAPAAGGQPVAALNFDQRIEPGPTTIHTEMQVADPRPWRLDDPFLYRATGRVVAAGSSSVDETSARFGFRDFRFEKGFFRLNGRRVFWTSAHTGADTPGGIRPPRDPDLLRRDLLNMKAMGFTGIRFISTLAPRFQLDMCDEIGLMVYEESHASWLLRESPKLAERMDRSLTGMVLRDRNHASIVMWGLLNETGDGPVFRQAASSLPLVRRLDDSRIVMLGSGHFDHWGNYINGLEVWMPDRETMPNLIYNPKPFAICFVPLWPSKSIALNHGNKGEYSVARWTAPAGGRFRLSAGFRASGVYALADIYVLRSGTPVFKSQINVNGRDDRGEYRGSLDLAKGEAVDFVVGGGVNYDMGPWLESCGDNTRLAARIESADGTTFDLSGDFSNSKNPNGAWSYGWFPAGSAPDASRFKPYAKCEIQKVDGLGGLSNPCSDKWEDILADQHYYPRVPHRELEISRLRTIAGNDNHLFLSEYGIGSGVDLPRLLRQFEQAGTDNCEMAASIRKTLTSFMEDWKRLRLEETFASAEDFFKACTARMAGLRKMGVNAIRSNPWIIGYSMTACHDPLDYGEGLTTAFREFKAGTMDAMFDAFYPVRWCVFAEPVSIYRGAKVRLEAVLSNQDRAPAGEYPARLRVVGPDGRNVLDRMMTVIIPGPREGREPLFVIPVFDEEVPVDGPSGKYRFQVTFEKGVAAAGGEAEFYVTDPAGMPPGNADIALWGDDPELAGWLKNHGMKVRPYLPGSPKTGEVILVSFAPHGTGSAADWRELTTRIARGSTAVFLVPDVFRKGDDRLGRLPLAKKGTLEMVVEYTFPQVYPKDEWAKNHPLFEGLQAGGLMDYTFYREILPDYRFQGQETPDEAVAGAFRTSCASYVSELMLSAHRLGAGRFILNAFRVRPALGQDPTAERLLRNMLRYAAVDPGRPASPPEAKIKELVDALGYE
jgi:Glycosyl hydrolases family 2/Glycosyl hydrolases family 2, sugar binding domain/Glycosyl hydrolases family 2, TIM barrel domain